MPPHRLFGPTRYQWDQKYFQQEIDQRIQAGVAEVKVSRKHGHRFLKTHSTTTLVTTRQGGLFRRSDDKEMG